MKLPKLGRLADVDRTARLTGGTYRDDYDHRIEHLFGLAAKLDYVPNVVTVEEAMPNVMRVTVDRAGHRVYDADLVQS